MELRYVGGVYAGNIKPTPFLCLILKMLQLQPDKEIAIEFVQQEEYKYIRALGAFYIRLTCNSVDMYKLLEPLYNDYRKIRYMNKMGKFELLHIDEFIDHLLRDERYCDIQLPRLQKRQALEDTDQLELYQSALDEDLDKLSASDSEEEEVKKERPSLVSKRDRRSRSRSRGRERSRSRERDRSRDRKRRASPDERGRRDKDRDDRRGRDKDDRKDRDRDRDRRKGKDGESLSIEETNAIRAKLGLKPLE